MFGDSWQGQIQFSAASTGNPHLKAIFPASTWLDNYTGSLYPGGVYNKGFGAFFEWSQKFLNSNVIPPVGKDRDGKLLAQAREERGNATVGEKFTEVFKQFRYRDSTTPEGYPIWLDTMVDPRFMNRVNQARVPTYMVAGWYDLFVRDMFQLYANLSMPKRSRISACPGTIISRASSRPSLQGSRLSWCSTFCRPPTSFLREDASA
jgi:uncharacterized protein